jgi:hypothetical protein
MITIEELLGRKGSGFDLENRDMAVGTHHADHLNLYIQKF